MSATSAMPIIPCSAVELNKTSNQQWLVERQADTSYKIYAYSGANSLQMLDCNNNVTTNGNPVTTYEDNGTPAQRWYFKSVGNGWYRIVPQSAGINSNQTLEIVGGSGAGGGGEDRHLFLLRRGQSGVSAGLARSVQNLRQSEEGIGGRETKAASMHCAWYYTWAATGPPMRPPAWSSFRWSGATTAMPTMAR